MEKVLFLYYIVLNIFAFVLMGWDKNQAKKRGWRIAEKNLLLIGLAGGFAGAYVGMRFFHHKTQHLYFVFTFLISLFVHIVIIWLLTSFLGVLTLEKLL